MYFLHSSSFHFPFFLVRASSSQLCCCRTFIRSLQKPGTSALAEVYPAERKAGRGVRRREGRKRRREDSGRQAGRQADGGNSWTSSSVVLIRELRCCETAPWGWLWAARGEEGRGGVVGIKHPGLLWLLVRCSIRRTSEAQQENGFL